MRKGDKFDVWKLKLHYSGGYESVGTAVLMDGRLYLTEQDDGKFFQVCVMRPVVLSPEMQALQHDNKDRSYKDPEYGVGIMVDEGTMVVGMGGNATQCVGYFEFSGHKLVGKLSEVREPTGLYDMVLTAPDDMVAKNPELFR